MCELNYQETEIHFRIRGIFNIIKVHFDEMYEILYHSVTIIFYKKYN